MSKVRYRCCEHCADDSPHPAAIGHGIPCKFDSCPGVVRIPTPREQAASAAEGSARPIPPGAAERPTGGREARWLDALTLPSGNRTLEQCRVETVSRAMALADIENAYLRGELADAKGVIARLTDSRARQAVTIQRFQGVLDEQGATIERRTDVLASLDGTLMDQEATISLLRAEGEDFRAAIGVLEGVIDKRNITITRLVGTCCEHGNMCDVDLPAGQVITWSVIDDLPDDAPNLRAMVAARQAAFNRRAE